MRCDCRRVEVAELDADTLAQIERIYIASFPPTEREPFDALVHDARRGRIALYRAVEEGVVQGFGVTLALPIQGTAYLAYLAVDSSRRGAGVGGQLFRSILESPATCHGITALVWEVERPEADAPPEDPKRRRITFYRRQGGVLLEQVRDFQMPNLAPSLPASASGTVPAMLMWATAGPRAALTRAETLAIVAAVYRVGYGRDLSDPLVRYVLSTVDADDSGSWEV
ncbi:MAG: GNAT family N-acetyltransferase [Anaerolineae bacterium]|jgi:GNAT superfamily N-acetyltransferase|nr:GNAT family N-acetyltransferase [Anaerolineae bacterium]